MNYSKMVNDFIGMGLKKYQFLATCDTDTCDVCGALDLKAFNCSDALEGVNLPPMHPGCRCTVVAYFPGEKGGERRIRTKDGKSIVVPTISYTKYKKKYLDTKN